MQRTFPL